MAAEGARLSDAAPTTFDSSRAGAAAAATHHAGGGLRWIVMRAALLDR